MNDDTSRPNMGSNQPQVDPTTPTGFENQPGFKNQLLPLSTYPDAKPPANSVTIPDVTKPQASPDQLSDPSTLEEATHQRLQLISRAVEAGYQAPTDPSEFETRQAPFSQPIQPSIFTPATTATDSRFKVSPFWANDTTDSRLESTLQQVIETVLEKYPVRQPRSILFAGVRDQRLLDQVATQVSRLLTLRHIGNILLIDGNTNTQAMSQVAACQSREGFTDAILGRSAWQAQIQTGATNGLEFLPHGLAECSAIQSFQLKELLKSIQSSYQFICISVGDFDSDLALLAAENCDGSFLLIDVDAVDDTTTNRAVAQLNSARAEVLGCIAIDKF